MIEAALADTEQFFEASNVTSISAKALKRHKARQDKTAKKIAQLRAEPLRPRTPNQGKYLWSLRNVGCVFGVGEAGVGKTYLASRHAIRQVLDGRVEKVVITRPTDSDPRHRLGFRPGNMKAKMAEWTAPIFQAMKAEVSHAELEKMVLAGTVQILPFESMRGNSVENACFLLDEAQNCTLKDLKLFLTRTGENTQVIINGDPTQCDLTGGNQSGLETVIDMVRRYEIPDCSVTLFDENDVVRSEIASNWVKAFSRLQR